MHDCVAVLMHGNMDTTPDGNLAWPNQVRVPGAAVVNGRKELRNSHRISLQIVMHVSEQIGKSHAREFASVAFWK